MNTTSFSSLSIENLFSIPDRPGPKELYSYVAPDFTIPVQSESFTIVLSRDVRKNTWLAAELAFRIAREKPAQDVWYINTYASVGLLKESFAKLFATAGIEPPTPVPIEEEDYLAEPYQRKDSEETANLVLPNLRIVHVPIGQWDTDELSMDIERRGRKDAKQVVIINSFEYAPLTRGRKEKMAIELLQLSSELELSIVIFSHEMKRDLEAGMPGKGPIGMLATRAEKISRLPDYYENEYGLVKRY